MIVDVGVIDSVGVAVGLGVPVGVGVEVWVGLGVGMSASLVAARRVPAAGCSFVLSAVLKMSSEEALHANTSRDISRIIQMRLILSSANLIIVGLSDKYLLPFMPG